MKLNSKQWQVFSLLACMFGFCCNGASASVVINEIHYDPEPDTAHLEFVELHNTSSATVHVGGWRFTAGIDFLIPESTSIPAGGYLVVAQDPSALLAEFGAVALGPWTGKLSNEGEKLVLRDAVGAVVDEVDYQRGFPWPVCPDGTSMELMNPALDNDLGASWRSSAYSVNNEATVFIEPSAPGWRYFKGTEEPSAPFTAWRTEAFDDTGWLTGQTSIGYGDDDDNTTLSDMKGGYSSVYLRKTFYVEASEVPPSLLLRLYVDDGAVVWINGTEVARSNVPDGELAYDAITGSWLEASWEELVISGAVLTAGTNVVAVHAVNQAINSSDFSVDLELRTDEGASLLPSPGEQNRVWTLAAPPAPRQVEHSPDQPTSGEAVVVSTKVTSPAGVGTVTLEFQPVVPGAYVRATDEAYDTGWTALPMTDNGAGGDAVAGDEVYSATIPANIQLHRHLIRYRITVEDLNGTSQQVPYADDDRRNFAYFVYDGVPAWTGADEPGVTAPETFSTNMMENTLPVYQLLATEADVTNCQYNSTYQETRFYGTMVYDGRVYDHIQFKVRGEWSTYKSGKNKWRFYFNTADDLEARDNYGEKYDAAIRRLNFNACASPWASRNRGMAGLDEAGSFRLHQLAGVLTPNTFYTHFRVVDSAEETPADQYAGDLWGLYMAHEHTDGRFLDEHDLPDGNTYKIVGASKVIKRNQSATQVTDDSDWTSFKSAIATRSEADWRSGFDLESYYSFRGINRVTSNNDLRSYANYNMYHHPDGQWVVIPQDLDAMLAPTARDGYGVVAMQTCLHYPEIENEFKNRCRELLDLLFSDDSATGGQAVQVYHELAQWVNPPGEALTFADVDQFMWNYHPRAGDGTGSGTEGTKLHRGQFYVTPDWMLMASADFEGFLQYITDYITDTDPDSFAVNDGDPRGYGFNYLEQEATDSNIPTTPTLTYTGADGYPVDELQFTSSVFDDPQGAGTFGALEWRIAEIRNPATPGYEEGDRWKYEIESVWESGDITTQTYSISPATDLISGRTYRARVRHRESSNHWSHWSTPVEFVALGRDLPRALMLSEVHYNPADPAAGSGYNSDDFEFVELVNNGTETIDLRGYALDGGIEFRFRGSAVESIAPGEYVVVVRNPAAFATRYSTSGLPIAGTYSGKLSNSGENVRLEFHGQKLFDISYNDARGWPQAADGGGHSLIPLTDTVAEQGFDILDHPGFWRASTYEHGSPGAADPEPMDDLVINEIVAHTDTGLDVPYDSNDQIELYNPTATAITLDGHWYLSDDAANPEQFNIPSGTVIPAGGWLLFDENDFHSDRVNGFGLNKAGEQVVLSHRPGAGLNRVVDCCEFEGQGNGSSWGRYPDGDAWFQTLEPTGGGSNQLAEPGVRIQQIMYHPLEMDGVDMDAQLEYILITNRSAWTVAFEDTVDDAGTWRMDGGINYSFAEGTSLAAGGSLWLVPFDPATDSAGKTLFCSTYGLDAGTVQLVGPYDGLLANSGERISLESPQASDDDSAPEDISWVVVDEVYWLDEAPWPADADGTGYALLRKGSSGNDPLSWTTTDDRDEDGLSDRWEMGFRTNLTDLGEGDFDGDGASDENEYRAGTDPTDAASLFEFKSIQTDPTTLLSWSSATGKVYSLWVSTNLISSPFTPSGVQLAATPPLNTYTSEVNHAECIYYRLQVDDE